MAFKVEAVDERGKSWESPADGTESLCRDLARQLARHIRGNGGIPRPPVSMDQRAEALAHAMPPGVRMVKVRVLDEGREVWAVSI
jgi:hypothetical protein